MITLEESDIGTKRFYTLVTRLVLSVSITLILSYFYHFSCKIANLFNILVGCISSGFINDNHGCIPSFQIAALFWISGTAVACFLPFIYLVVVGRILKGIAMGMISSIVPVYVSETIQRKRKGNSLAIIYLHSTIGTLLIYYMSFFLQKYFEDELSFKYAWACEGIPGVILILLTFFLPESPKWLASKGKWLEAAKNLEKLQAINTTKQNRRGEIDDRSYVLCAYTAGTEIKGCGFGDLFKKKYYSHTSVGLFTQFFVHTSCAGSLMYFFDYLCATCGLNGDHKYLFVSVQYIVLAMFTFFLWYY